MLLEKILKQRRLRSIGIEITNRCNLNCPHCIIPSRQRIKGNELSPAFIKSLIPILVNNGCQTVLITGGEPLLHKNFKEIYHLIKMAGMEIEVFTNGTLLNSEMLNYFKLYPPKMLAISLYGANDEEYSSLSFSGAKGIFASLLDTIRILPSTGVNFLIQCRVSKYSRDLGGRLQRILGGNVKLPEGYFIYPRSKKDNSNTRCMLSFEDQKKEIAKRSLANRYKSWITVNAALHKENLLFACGTGYANVHLTADRKITLCPFFKEIYFDLDKFTLEEIFFKKIPPVLKKKIPKESTCYECPLRKFCAGCVICGFGSVNGNGLRRYLCYSATLFKKYAERKEKNSL